MKKILITGCNGQIGNAILKKIKHNNIIGIDINTDTIPYDVEFYKCNLLNTQEIKKIKHKLNLIEIYIPLTSTLKGGCDINDVNNIMGINIFSVTNLLPFLPKLKHIIFPSSMMVYGEPIKSPIKEDHELNPSSWYGISKIACEKILKIYCKNKNINLSIFRITGVYGFGKYSGDRCKSIIPDFINSIKNGKNITIKKPNEKRDYIHTDDVVNAFFLTIKKPFNGIINIGTNKGIRIVDVANIIKKSIKSKTKIIINTTNNEKLDYTLDISKAKELIGYKPKISIEEGIKNEIYSINNNRE